MVKFSVQLPDFIWTVEATCSLLQKPFQRELVLQQFAAPYDGDSVAAALSELGIASEPKKLKLSKLRAESFPVLVWLAPAAPTESEPGTTDLDSAPDPTSKNSGGLRPALILQADSDKALIVQPGDAVPVAISLSALQARSQGHITRLSTQVSEGTDPDGAILAAQSRRFGFGWFIPELLKHKKLWQEILLASLVIQLLALATPLFTQTIIDKVIVNRTQSTLIVVLIGMAVFVVFTTVLSWLRQYLVLHTGNRVDAVLGAAVFERLFKLPPLYFQHRPTGVISARLHGVETIREFIAGTAVTLILDFPFLLIFVAIMFY